MRYFFKLQYKMLSRHISDFGVHPLIGFSVIGFFCYSLTSTLFQKTIYAEYLLFIAFISILIKLNNEKRITFFKTHFNSNYRLKIKILEHILVAIPFLILLILHKKHSVAICLFITSICFSFISFKNLKQYSIPTPFYKYPFEFLIGFRKNYILLFALYIIGYIGIYVDNFNLSIVALCAIVLCATSFFSKLESSFYVWIFSLKPKAFLDYKIQLIIKYTLLLCLPITLPLIAFYFENILVILAIQCIGVLFVTTTMLGKYAVFPSSISLQQSLGILLSILFPPILLFIIPYYYNQSKKRLNSILQ